MWQYDFLFLTVSKINSTEGPKSVKFSFFFELIVTRCLGSVFVNFLFMSIKEIMPYIEILIRISCLSG